MLTDNLPILTNFFTTGTCFFYNFFLLIQFFRSLFPFFLPVVRLSQTDRDPYSPGTEDAREFFTHKPIKGYRNIVVNLRQNRSS
jgi:hypothetical protein